MKPSWWNKVGILFPIFLMQKYKTFAIIRGLINYIYIAIYKSFYSNMLTGNANV